MQFAVIDGGPTIDDRSGVSVTVGDNLRPTQARTIRHRLSIGVLAIAASVLLSGCPPQEPADGDYPKLEATVASIDWIGDGIAPSGVEIKPGGSRLQIRTEVEYPTPDSTALQLKIEERLKSFPTVFLVTADREGYVLVEGDDWEVYVVISGLDDGTPSVSLGVSTVDNDDRAVESLAPIIEVLGTIP